MQDFPAPIGPHRHPTPVAASLRGAIVLAATICCAAPDIGMAAGPEEMGPQTKAVPRGRIFAQGFLYENEQPRGMTIAAIDPETGSWSRLPVNASTFDVSPD